MSEPAPRAAANVIHVAVAVVSRGQEYLIGQRPAGVPLAGMWEFPGGKMQAGESAAETAVRECREETGLAVRALPGESHVVQEYAHGVIDLTFVPCEPLDPQAAPRAPFRWVAGTELPKYEFPAANHDLVRRLAAVASNASKSVLPGKTC